ncbi:flagellar hook-length control protein [Mycobacterium sp.]|uniref:flagellar hook-length control protein n=1 Tax=Mycobacterium sp. TaxID=1785 RepID=UPI003D6A4AED
MTSMTKHDAINGAMSLADDVAQGRLDPAALEATAVAELGELFGTVVGEGDPAWPMHCSIARQAIALGALSGDELAEWAAVWAGPGETPPPPESPASVAHSAAEVDATAVADQTTQADAGQLTAETTAGQPEPATTDSDPQPAPAAIPPPAPPRGGYDPLRGWLPSRSLHRG